MSKSLSIGKFSHNLYAKSKSHWGAWKRGIKARYHGFGLRKCPYRVWRRKPKQRHFIAIFKRLWIIGWNMADRQLSQGSLKYAWIKSEASEAGAKTGRSKILPRVKRTTDKRRRKEGVSSSEGSQGLLPWQGS